MVPRLWLSVYGFIVMVLNSRLSVCGFRSRFSFMVAVYVLPMVFSFWFSVNAFSLGFSASVFQCLVSVYGCPLKVFSL